MTDKTAEQIADELLEKAGFRKAHTAKAGAVGAARHVPWQNHVFTAAQLRLRTFPSISYVVPDLLPDGLSIIAGRPKIGKSWLALDVCIAVASGQFCLGERKPVQGDVLYAALEDNPRRLQRRIDKLLSPFKAPWPERLTLATSWRRLDKGGVDDVCQWIESKPEPRLVVLDTLAGVRPIRTTQGYAEDYQVIGHAASAGEREVRRYRCSAPHQENGGG